MRLVSARDASAAGRAIRKPAADAHPLRHCRTARFNTPNLEWTCLFLADSIRLLDRRLTNRQIVDGELHVT